MRGELASVGDSVKAIQHARMRMNRKRLFAVDAVHLAACQFASVTTRSWPVHVKAAIFTATV